MPIKLAIGCYHNLLGEALKKLIGGDKEVHVVRVFSAGADLDKIARTNPDVLLIDLQTLRSLPKELFSPAKTKILLIGDPSSLYSCPRWCEDLIARGVVGVLPAGTDLNTLKKALKSVFAGEFWLGRKLVARILSVVPCPARAPRRRSPARAAAVRPRRPRRARAPAASPAVPRAPGRRSPPAVRPVRW